MAGGRALLPLIEASVIRRPARIVDGEGKTVCHLVVETTGTASGPIRPAEYLELTPLRGYEADSNMIASAVRPANQDGLLVQLLGRAGAERAPGERPAGADLTPDMPAAEAMASILRNLLDTVQANVPGTIGRYDTEFLHDLRVAVRRGRTALKLARGVVAEAPRAELAQELKWLANITSPARDLDVHLLQLPDLEAMVASDLRAAVAPFGELLCRRGESAHEELDRNLASERFRQLSTGAPALLTALSEDPPKASRDLVAAQFARLRIEQTYRRVRSRGRRIDEASPDEAVHDLRKRAKELRYALEFFSGLAPGQLTDPLVEDLKGLQDVLGRCNDTVVQRALVADAADELRRRRARTSTLLALGEMSAHLLDAGRRARAKLPGRTARLGKWRRDKRWQHLLAELQ
jgi:CHAD domain-containing protein